MSLSFLSAGSSRIVSAVHSIETPAEGSWEWSSVEDVGTVSVSLTGVGGGDDGGQMVCVGCSEESVASVWCRRGVFVVAIDGERTCWDSCS